MEGYFIGVRDHRLHIVGDPRRQPGHVLVWVIVAALEVTLHDPDRCDKWMHENGIDRRRIWQRLFNMHNELLFEHNLFYTQLNPSSIMLLKDNRIALVSLGTIATLDAELQAQYRSLYRALIDVDYTKAYDTYLNMSPGLPYKDISNMKQSASRALRKWEAHTHVKNFPYSQKSLGAAVGQLARCASEQKLPACWNLARLQSAEKILNISLEFLDPTKSSIKALKTYESAAQLRSIKQATTKNLQKRVNGAVDVAQLNMQLFENLQHDGDYLRRRLMGVQGKLSKLSEISGRAIMVVARLAMVALAMHLYLFIKHGYKVSVPLAEPGTGEWILAALRPQSKAVWLLVIVLLFYLRRFLVRIARQFFAQEVRPGDVV